MANQSIVGAVATVTRTIRGGRLPGEIRVLDAGEPVLMMAYSVEPREIGERVRITHNRGSRQVDVSTWP
ncbi:MAG: hypothetical protein M3Y06_05510 [Actinomycetota bacterium]|nr:hypothetical protein [Actinomycetota bacterium]